MMRQLQARDGSRPESELAGPEALLASVAAHGFDELQVSVSFRTAQNTWYSISRVPNVVEFETEHGSEARRWPYNDRLCAEAKRTGRVVSGMHAGFYDLF